MLLILSYARSKVAGAGFPRGGGANPPGGAPTFQAGRHHTILPIISKKLHEIERIWTVGREASKTVHVNVMEKGAIWISLF